MIRRHLIALLSSALALTLVEASWPTASLAKDGGSDGGGSGGSGGGSGGGDSSGRGGGDDGGSGGGRGGGDSSGRGGGDDGNRGGDGSPRGGDDGGGRGRGRGGDDGQGRTGWGSTSSERAREAVSQGWALGLSTVLPTVSRAVPGQVLEVDLRRTWSGDWRYEFLVLTRDRRYQEVTVDARSNRVLQIRRR
jgi:hypothetical protein